MGTLAPEHAYELGRTDEGAVYLEEYRPGLNAVILQ